MFKTLPRAIALLTIVLTPCLVSAQEKPAGDPADSQADARKEFDDLLQSFDKNKDQALQVEELGSLAGELRRLDTNSDGSITVEEYLAKRTRKPASAKGPGESPEDLLELYDSDKSTSLSREEAGFLFELEMDRDKSGSIEHHELMEMVLERGVRPRALLLLSKLDRDRTRSISKQEKPEFFSEEGSLDADKNGEISLEELAVGLSRDDARRLDKALELAKTYFTAYDANGDQMVDKKEGESILNRFPGADVNGDDRIGLAEYLHVVKEEFAFTRFLLPPILDRFRSLDANGDLSIEKSECASDPSVMAADLNKDQVVSPRELRSSMMRSNSSGFSFDAFDLNRDGKITKEEAPKLFKNMKMIDKDKNGEISKEEFEGFFKGKKS